jgi:hypothetical protein
LRLICQLWTATRDFIKEIMADDKAFLAFEQTVTTSDAADSELLEAPAASCI